MDGMKLVKAKLGVFLHPSRAGNVKQGVHEVLNSLLCRYNEEFDGVVLAYLATKIMGSTAKILSVLSPYFQVQLTATLLLFSPKPKMRIEGKVNKVEKDYIGVVVLGLFNAAVGFSDIREDLYYDESSRQSWVSETDDQHIIKLGSIISFEVKSLQETEQLIDICGSLLEPNTGCVDWISKSAEPQKKKKKKA